jgi:hypothetical protein
MRITRRIVMAFGILLLLVAAWLTLYIKYRPHPRRATPYFGYYSRTSGPVPPQVYQSVHYINPKSWTNGWMVSLGSPRDLRRSVDNY